MKTIIFILLLAVSSASLAGDYDRPKYQTLNQRYEAIEAQKRENMMRGLEREVWEIGRISPKTPLDVGNLRNGYGYDGGISVPNGNYPAGGSYGYGY
ncbi:hypothetical protein [Nitrosomonas marina]|uniref:Uncharacterized protein n=1 Tax=Nitrosomonas marina TaxID=917 RepID=A0A1H8GPM1_9PROT|nr:hypothetical protein [Nitrosomonas marina]SEN45745.1 hypothetical protein SAMN05216325_1192 [Nitrosomonas marina]